MNILIKLTCLVGLVIAPILGGSNHHNENSEKTAVVSASKKDCKMNCCSKKEKKELSYKEENPNLDSIEAAEREKAIRIGKTISDCKKDCKKPCCKGCKATDTIGLVLSCLYDHSCCNPNFN